MSTALDMFLDLTLEVGNRIRTQVNDVRLEVRRSTTFINLPLDPSANQKQELTVVDM
jgi:hypothetical protein